MNNTKETLRQRVLLETKGQFLRIPMEGSVHQEDEQLILSGRGW